MTDTPLYMEEMHRLSSPITPRKAHCEYSTPRTAQSGKNTYIPRASIVAASLVGNRICEIPETREYSVNNA